ncbi:MAG: UDP-N-acetylglucosamine 4,6-dehydratase (inverting) [Planctomycetota bacterium]|jgi:UDP-N-acetylglucosamine 4,6-dehydratase|nr:UDP-N-acetylglucosamine 4,6-dehydratase (inverting) [Planctomycetota bacterium]
MDLDGKAVLVTGGTGSFGRKFVSTLLARHKPRKVAVFSRDELKQSEMMETPEYAPRRGVQYFIGDVREPDRLRTAFRGIDVIVHAAALKQVPACEYNPFEAIKTNVLGAQNIITAAIEAGVARVVALSTDKAAGPVNLYGATKLCSDKLFIAGNNMAGVAETRFSVVRYGNVVGSRGSVIPYFQRQAREQGRLTVTDSRMTRFSITLGEGVDFVLACLGRMTGGELFVPKIPSYRILDVAGAVAPGMPIEEIGIRPGEKLHESMITPDDARDALEFTDHYLVQPTFGWWNREKCPGGRPCPEGFAYTSDKNGRWLTVDELRALIERECPEKM